ncbi:SIS domain-containing protein [Candidatus Thorarchaeota archaeon]|nr:MAG: SIS domain-containing protein [Candidatus Thorarchaeota archaeon]
MTEFLDSCYEVIKVQERSIADTINSVDLMNVSDITEKQQIVLIGAGDSYAVSEYGKWLFRAIGLNAISLSPPEVIHVPMDSDTVVIGVTASGRSLSTLDALQKTRAKGAKTIVLTDDPEGKASEETSNLWVTKAGVDSYNISPASPTTTAMAYLLTIAAEIDSKLQEDLQSDIKQLAKIGKNMLEWAEREGKIIARLVAPGPPLYMVSDGPNHVAAQIGMMKFNEFAVVKGFAALREDFCHHQNLSIDDGDQALLVSGKKEPDDERYMKVLTEVLNMQAHHIYVPEEFGLKTALAQTIPNSIALQMGAHFTVRRYNPKMEWFRMPHAKAFRIY